MDPEFWLQRWREGSTGFHMSRVSPLLEKYWPELKLDRTSRVLVPLCGKTLDMVWLAQQGHQVLGVELAPMAVNQFFEEHELTPTLHESEAGTHYVADRIEIICGDIFLLEADTLRSCTGVYDRGALVALPTDMRERYVRHVYGNLASRFRGVLLTVEYDQSIMDGPPFSIPSAEVQQLFAGQAEVEEVGRLNIIDKEPRFAERGLDRFDSVSWRLQGRL